MKMANLGTVLSKFNSEYSFKTPKKLKIIDAYLMYILLTGIVQFVYCLLVGTFPFNSFLSGFISTVSCFVLAVCLRLQVNPENKVHFRDISPERGYADFIFAHVILHLVVMNFIGRHSELFLELFSPMMKGLLISVFLSFCVGLDAKSILDVDNVVENEVAHASVQIQTLDEISRINQICMEQTRVDKDLVRNVIESTTLPSEMDENYGKFLGCSYRKQKYLDKDGRIQMENIKKFLAQFYKAKNLNVLDVCGELKQTNDAGENAFNAFRCILPKLVSLE